MAEYVERETLYEKAYWHGEHPDVGNPFPDGVDAIDIKDVDAIPTADVAPVRHGRWIDRGDYVTTAYGSLPVKMCSECHMDVTIDDFENYCPNCGARMDGGDSDETD